jgi:hypothetical protein
MSIFLQTHLCIFFTHPKIENFQTSACYKLEFFGGQTSKNQSGEIFKKHHLSKEQNFVMENT